MSRTKRVLMSAGLAAVLIGMLAFLPVLAGGPGPKVILCHTPPGFGYGPNPHTIEVEERAVPAHLAHGDTLGPCP